MSDVAVELGLAATTNLTLDDSRVRKLAKRETAGSAIGLADLYGKANLEYEIHLWRLLWRSGSSPGGTKWEYLYGLKFIVNTPPGVILTGLAAYNSDGTTLFDRPLTGADPAVSRFASLRTRLSSSVRLVVAANPNSTATSLMLIAPLV
jgi:hypothetical protein